MIGPNQRLQAQMAARWMAAAVATLATVGLAVPSSARADVAPPPAVKPRPQPAPESGPAVIREGTYKCEFTQGEFRYPAFRCQITKRQTAKGTARYELEKLGGSQRVKGVVEPTEAGFHFSGQYFCPHGACTEATQGDFARVGRDRYDGSLKTSTGVTQVKLWK